MDGLSFAPITPNTAMLELILDERVNGSWGRQLAMYLGDNSTRVFPNAIRALECGNWQLLAALDTIPAPIYVTDATGLVIYFNPFCVAFTGRNPQVGKDRWCVTWKLYTEDGSPLKHDACPMAEAIRTKRPIRNAVAIAERPDGKRVRFTPFPTPLLGENGDLLGAVNILIDLAEPAQPDDLTAQAERCRRLAAGIAGDKAQQGLLQMANAYETQATLMNAAESLQVRTGPHHSGK